MIRVSKGGGRTDDLGFRLAALVMTATGVAARGGRGGASGASGEDAGVGMILLYVFGALAILLATLFICRRYTQYGLPKACACCCRAHRVGVTETGAEISTGSLPRGGRQAWGDVVPGIDRNEGPS